MPDPFSPAERSAIMRAVRSRDTAPEIIVRRLVESLGYRHRLYDANLPGTPDIVIPRLRTVIFVSGCFWHMHTCGRCRIPKARRRYWENKLHRNRSRDALNRGRLRRMGWSVLTVWECHLRDEERVRNFLVRHLHRRAEKITELTG